MHSVSTDAWCTKSKPLSGQHPDNQSSLSHRQLVADNQFEKVRSLVEKKMIKLTEQDEHIQDEIPKSRSSNQNVHARRTVLVLAITTERWAGDLAEYWQTEEWGLILSTVVGYSLVLQTKSPNLKEIIYWTGSYYKCCAHLFWCISYGCSLRILNSLELLQIDIIIRSEFQYKGNWRVVRSPEIS